MHKLYELKDKLIDELEAYSENGKYSKDDVEVIKYMASAVDHLCNIIEDADDEYSNGMYYGDGMESMSYARGRRGGRGSYARGRGRNARRDSMGRYSSEGYSRAADDMVMELRDIMQDATDPMVRQEMEKLVNKLEKM